MSPSTSTDAPTTYDLELDPRDTAIRILLTLLFTIVSSVLNTVLRVLVAFSLVWALITRQAPHPRLRSLANRIVSYEYRLNRYITYNEAVVPFPFTDLPGPLEAPTWNGDDETARAVGLSPRRRRERDDGTLSREPWSTSRRKRRIRRHALTPPSAGPSVARGREKQMIRRALTTCIASLAVVLSAGVAYAAPVTYVLQTPGVVWGGTASRARAAVEKVAGTDSVTTDMDAHTVTVEFDDDELSIGEIIQALAEAGYSVPSHSKIP